MIIVLSSNTAGSCFSGKGQENQGLGEFEEGFLYQIHTKIFMSWGCDMVGRKKYLYFYARRCIVVICFETVKDIYIYVMCYNIVKQIL